MVGANSMLVINSMRQTGFDMPLFVCATICFVALFCLVIIIARHK